jgi:hypothetical protein
MSLMEKLRLFNQRKRRQQRNACLDVHEYLRIERGIAFPTFEWLYDNVGTVLSIGGEEISPARFAAMNRHIMNNGADCLERGIRE